MKGFLFLVGLAGTIFPLKALWLRRQAKKGEVDPETLRKVPWPTATGAGWPWRADRGGRPGNWTKIEEEPLEITSERSNAAPRDSS